MWATELVQCLPSGNPISKFCKKGQGCGLVVGPCLVCEVRFRVKETKKKRGQRESREQEGHKKVGKQEGKEEEKMVAWKQCCQWLGSIDQTQSGKPRLGGTK